MVNPEQGNAPAIRLVLLGVLGNAVLALIKGTAGILGNSYALIADAIESTTDVFSSLLLYFGLRLASHPPDANHPYGHGRAESLATFITVAFLLASAGIIVYKSIIHIITPHKVPASFTLIVLLTVVAVKEGLFRLFRQKSSEAGNGALEAEAWHHRSDALTSLAAFFGITVSLVMGKGWESADDWAALVAAAIIFYNAWRIFRPALADIMDEDRFGELRARIIAAAEQEDIVQAVQECLVRKLGSTFVVDLRLLVDGRLTVTELCLMKKRLRTRLAATEGQLGRIFIECDGVGC
jgi:cation diffusion facilitator family transporter